MQEKHISRLHFITLDEYRIPPEGQVLLACKSGIKWVQLRMKRAGKARILRAAEEAREICSRYAARLIINDHPDIAIRCGADGVHLGGNDMAVDKARALTGPRMIIGGTANSPEDALKRIEQGADYIGAGPFRFTRTKKNLSPLLGKAGIAAILEKLESKGIDLPVIAVGGITVDDLQELLTIPLHGVAISGSIVRSSEPGQLIKKIEHIFNKRNNHADNCR